MTETARDLMSEGVQCVPFHESLDRAAQLMREHNVGALPVSGPDEKIQGILTDRDIVVKCVAAGQDPARITAGELAGDLVWVTAEATVEETLQRMEENQIRRLPVLDEERGIVGMISEADLARQLPEERLAQFVRRVYAN